MSEKIFDVFFGGLIVFCALVLIALLVVRGYESGGHKVNKSWCESEGGVYLKADEACISQGSVIPFGGEER